VRIPRRLAIALAAPAVFAAALLAAVPAQASAIPVGLSGVHSYNTPVCGVNKYIPVDLGHGDYFNVYTSQSGNTCVDSERHHLTWGVTSVSRNEPWQYSFIGSGIFWGRYTCYDGRSAYPTSPGSECMRYPVQQYRDGMPVTSVRYWPGTLAEGNVAYDIWFNKTDEQPKDVKQDNGAEIMIWLDHPGVGVWNVVRTVTIDRIRWYVMAWTMSRPSGITWHYVAYVAVHPVQAVNDLWLNQFFREAEANGELSRDWWLTGIDFGSEMSVGGKGFTVSRYSLTGVS
jgi:hypothetical protein